MKPSGPSKDDSHENGKPPKAKDRPPEDWQAAHARPDEPLSQAQGFDSSDLEAFQPNQIADPSMDPSVQTPGKQGGLLFYTTPKGALKINVYFQGETAWLTQKALADLFGVQIPAVAKHLKNIYESGELSREATVSKMEIVHREGGREVKRPVEFYNLDAIIAVGYRVNSLQATQFRIWATETLKGFLVKGFALDDERLKQGPNAFGRDYFDELLERIREIRSSERRFYQKITDIYALAVDYRKDDPTTKEFFAMVQNKLHWAITGKTAAETIHDSADATKPHMGLRTWKQAPQGKVLKSDVVVAKNYLEEPHIQELNRIVSAYLELAASRAQRMIHTTMKDWSKFLEDFLELSSYPVLPDKGRVSALEAKLKAEREYEIFRPLQDANFLSDFDQEVLKRLGKKE